MFTMQIMLKKTYVKPLKTNKPYISMTNISVFLRVVRFSLVTE